MSTAPLDEEGEPARRAFTRLAFSEAVRSAQVEYGTREFCERLEQKSTNAEITQAVAEFIGRQTSFFLATSSLEGWPHVQHRGGPPGFLRVLSPRLLAFGDFDGNRQFISVGNINVNPQVNLLMVDYREPRRLKIWGRAVVSPPRFWELAGAVQYPDYPDRIARIITIDVQAWDFNCGRHLNGVNSNPIANQGVSPFHLTR